MELVGDLVRSAGDADDRGDPVGEQAGHVDVPLRERAGGVPDDQQQAPRIDRARDQDGQLGPSVGEDRDRRIARVVALKDGRERRVARPVATGGHSQDTTEDPERRRHLHESQWGSDVGGGMGARRQPIAIRLPDGHQVMAVGIADDVHRPLERLFRIAHPDDQAADGRGGGQVELDALRLERIRSRRAR